MISAFLFFEHSNSKATGARHGISNQTYQLDQLDRRMLNMTQFLQGRRERRFRR